MRKFMRNFYWGSLYYFAPFRWIANGIWKLFGHPRKEKRWVFKFNISQLDRSPEARRKDPENMGEPGKEVYAEEIGFYRMHQDKGKQVWNCLRQTGDYRVGHPPEKGEKINKKQFSEYKSAYDSIYDT